MIQMQTSLEVADNSGARRVEMIMPIGGSTGKIASLGDRIKVTVKEASPDGTIKKGTVQDAVIVRTRKEVRRADGTYVRFDQNAAVLIKERYQKDVAPQIAKEFGITNPMGVPRLEKIVVNMGMGEAIANAKILDTA